MGRGREGDILPTVEVKEGAVVTAYASNLRGPVGDAIQNRRVQRSFYNYPRVYHTHLYKLYTCIP